MGAMLVMLRRAATRFFFMCALCVLLHFAGGQLYAQARVLAEDWVMPGEKNTEAYLAVAEFRFSGTQARGAFLGENVARLFREKLSEVPTHTIGEAEAEDYARGLITQEREKILKKINELGENISALYFAGAGLRDTAKEETLREELAEERKKLLLADALSPQDVQFVREKKILLMGPGTKRAAPTPTPPPAGAAGASSSGSSPRPPGSQAAGASSSPGGADRSLGLFPPVSNPQRPALKADADYFLSGVIQENLAGYISVSVSFYGARAGRVLFSSTASGSLDELEALVDKIFLSLADAVTGRPWATLEIKAEPGDALVFVDDKLAGIGRVKLAYVEPKEYRISLYADGHDVFEETLTLEAGSSRSLTFPLNPNPLPEILVDSFPQGADVYLGAMKKGQTPLPLPSGGAPDILSLSLSGYKTRVLPSNAAGAAGPHALPRSVFSWNDRVEIKREEFYRAWGFFVLSLPLPLALYGLYQNEFFGFTQFTNFSGYDREKAQSMDRNAKFLYYAYFGSIFLSGSLLVNAIQKLREYIRTGEESQKYPDSRDED